MSGLPNDKRDRLLALLEEELELFGRYRELTGEQSALLEADDIEALGKSLVRRQRIIEKINGLHQEKELLMQSYVSFSKSGAENKDIETLRGKLQGVMQEISELDKKNIAMAEGKPEQYSQQINKLSMSRKSIGLYGQGVINDAEYFDKKT